MTENPEIATLQEDPAWARARARAAAQREFYGHLATYLLVSAFLVVIDVAGGSSGTTFLGLDWAYWPIGGWGVAVVLHALRVFGPSNGWEERKANQLYEKERQRGPRQY